MKKIYKQPTVRTIDLFEEEGIMGLSNDGKMQLHDDVTVNSQMSNEKENLWGSEGIWK